MPSQLSKEMQERIVDLSIADIAQAYGISFQNTWSIVTRKLWRRVA